MGSPFQAAQAFCSSWALMVWGSHMGTLRARRPLLVNRVVTGVLGVGKPSAEHRYLVSIRIYTLEYRFIEHSKCGKCFKYKAYFIKYQRVHNGESPYECR